MTFKDVSWNFQGMSFLFYYDPRIDSVKNFTWRIYGFSSALFEEYLGNIY